MICCSKIYISELHRSRFQHTLIMCSVLFAIVTGTELNSPPLLFGFGAVDYSKFAIVFASVPKSALVAIFPKANEATRLMLYSYILILSNQTFLTKTNTT